MNITLSFFLASFFLYFIANAQEAVPLPASEVRAGEIINSEMLEIKSSEWEGKNLSLADLLATYPGIQTRQRGGMGSFQTISIRGMQGNQIAIAVDGVILQSLGATDLGGIDLNQYERIEVYKGFIPAKFAANGMGGVINLVSKDAAAKSGKFYASYGSYNSRVLSMQASSPLTDSVFWVSSINYRASDNDYPYLNRNGTEYNTDDDFWTRRKNAQYLQISGNHSFRFVHKKNTVLRIEHNSAAGGIPGREDQETKTANSASDALLASYEIEPFPFFKSISLGFQAFTGLEKNMSAWYYPLDKIGYSIDEYTQSGILLKSGGGQGSFYFEKEKIKTELYAHYNYQYLESRNKSVMLSDYELSNSILQFSFAGELIPADFFNIKTNAAIRLNKEKQEKGKVSGIFMGSDYEENSRNLKSGRISMNFGKENSLWSSGIAAGHYFRAPSLVELFSTSFGVLSNPNLKAEQGEQAELSIGYRHKKTRIAATAFANRIRDRIVYHTSGQLSKPINAEKGEVYGIETELYSEVSKWLKISSNATFQNPGTLPNEPNEQYYSSMIFTLPYSFELRLEGEAHSGLYRDKAQRKKIPENSFYHAGLSYKPTAANTISFYARNINGAEYQNIYDAHPTPGRVFNLSYWHYF
ncbi:MAG: TonB-dependent receptor [Fibromonadaceae bacterium]|jgi:outer membrane cobalamin receptor|nr:TonB-dependent receptor [Fibromonadaceae bacterium]